MSGQARALSPWLYVRRNARRVLPLLGMQALVTMLLVSLLTPTNAFRATSEAYAQAFDDVTTISPLRQYAFDEALLAKVDANPAAASRAEAKMFWIETPLIVGKAYAPILAVRESDRAPLLERMGATLRAGRWPAVGTQECALHHRILRARKLEIGDVFGRLVDPSDATPGRFEIVGSLEGPARIGVADFAYASESTSVLARTPPFQIVTAQDGHKAESDAYLRALRNESEDTLLRVVDRAFVQREIDRILENLPVLLTFITTCVAAIVGLITGLLALVAFQARTDEFAMYLAVGQPSGRLLKKILGETLIVAIGGWLLGLLAGHGLLALYQRVSLDPRGIVMHMPDPLPVALSAMVPVLSTLIAGLVLWRRLRRMDPVAVMQRRGA